MTPEGRRCTICLFLPLSVPGDSSGFARSSLTLSPNIPNGTRRESLRVLTTGADAHSDRPEIVLCLGSSADTDRFPVTARETG
ncbi:ATP-dependent DNA helicase RecQ [Anopheles sinensis]|uniref:ATP-dependent DNA helicase RecQ n=1 Tax=Anopheles sinensis TaxID=74873 RepID=A0A084WS47_ANOSI|nr:ATP-dependent DNA helicase RecQ [Anopheles sinensis]